MLVFSKPEDCGDDAAAVEASKYGKRDDKHVVAEQSPAQVSQVMKHDKTGNTGDQVENTDCHQHPHPPANGPQVDVVIKVRRTTVFEALDRLPHFDVSHASVQHLDHDETNGDDRLYEANDEMHVRYRVIVTQVRHLLANSQTQLYIVTYEPSRSLRVARLV